MHLTPKFDRKTLALTLVCLVLTLVTFGIVLVTYFFYAQTNSLFSIEPIPVPGESLNNNRKVVLAGGGVTDTYRSNSNRHRDHTAAVMPTVNRSQAKERAPSEDLFGNNIKSNTYILANSKQDRRLRLHYDEGSSATGTSSTNTIRAGDQLMMPRNGEDTGGGGGRSGANSETIYIDDYDRMLDATTTTTPAAATPTITANGQDPGPDKRRLSPTSAPYAAISDRLDINNIDYFDSILKDRSDAAIENGPMPAKLMVPSSVGSIDDSPTVGGDANRLHKKKKQRGRGELRRRKGTRQQRPVEATMSNKYFTGSRLSSMPSSGIQRKNILVTRTPLNIRRSFIGRNRDGGGHRRRIDDDDDDEESRRRANTFSSSDQLLDNDDDDDDDDELIGSGSGDFIDEEEDDLDDTEIYVAVGGEHPGQYRMDVHRRRENAYSVMDEVEPELSSSGVASSRRTAVIGSSLKKWIPPSIVSSSQESRMVTIAASTTTSTTTTTPTAAAVEGGVVLTTTYPLTSTRNLHVKLPATVGASQQQQQSPQPQLDSVSLQLQQKDQQELQQQTHQQQQLLLSHNFHQNSGAWYETRARRIMGNVKKSEERSRQLLLCAEAGGGELCRMLFKGHLNE